MGTQDDRCNQKTACHEQIVASGMRPQPQNFAHDAARAYGVAMVAHPQPSLASLCAAVAAQPASIGARAALAHHLDALGVPAAAAVWMATARAAARRGHFHAALTLARRHLSGARQAELLEELADIYGAARPQSTTRRPPPMPEPRVFVAPADPDTIIDAAVRLGTDLGGVLLEASAALPEMPLFSALPKSAFVALARSLVEARFETGQALIRQGDEDRRVLVLAQGTVCIERVEPEADAPAVTLATATAPALVGEMAVLTAVARRASVVAASPVLAWVLDGETVERLGHEHPEVVRHLAGVVKRRLLANLTRTSAVFSGLVGGVLPAGVAERFNVRVVPAQTCLVDQGAPPPGLFVVLHGDADVWVRSSDGERARVAVLREGDVFGELSLLSGAPTTASVLVSRGAVVLHLSVDDFEAVRGALGAVVSALAELSDTRRGELNELASALADEDAEEIVDADWLTLA